MKVPRPLEGRYTPLLTSAIIALVPFIIVTTGFAMYRQNLLHELKTGRTALELISGMSTAGYAFGAFFGGDIVQRFPQRKLFLICEALFTLGCALAGAAPGVVMFGSGEVLMGFSTGLLLVIALPPVVQRFPPEKLPTTVVAIDMGFFGAVCLGPLLGGLAAGLDGWRWFYASLAFIAFANLCLALLSLPDQDPPNPELKFDAPALLLGFASVVLPFFASSELSANGFASFIFTVPLALGIACLVALLLLEYHKNDPLSPVRPMWVTLPVVGTLAAMIGGGLFVSLVELAEAFHMQVARLPPLQTGLLFWPMVVGALITSVLLGVLIRTRFLPILVLGGMFGLIAGGALLLGLEPHGSARTLAASGILGLAAGATVSPGLYLAGLPLPVTLIGRIFALVELVRSLADYILAPVILQVARVSSGKALDIHGIHEALWVCVLIGIGSTLFGAALYLAGAPGLPKPDLVRWVKEKKPALWSPPLLASLRGRMPWPHGFRPREAAVHVRNERVISAPKDRVWAWLVRAEQWPDWAPPVREAAILDGPRPELRPGTRFRWATSDRFDSVVRDYAEGALIGWTGRADGLAFYQAWRIEDRGESCAVRVEESRNGRLARLEAWLLPDRVHRHHRMWLEGLQARAQRGEPPAARQR